jgi:hypothetical protein
VKPQTFGYRFAFGGDVGWTAAQVRAAVDLWVANWLPVLSSRQETFLAANGRYWQGLASHAARPSHLPNRDGGGAGDRLTDHPTDQAQDWVALLPEWQSVLLPAEFRVDVYDGGQGQGKGWTLAAEFAHNGSVWRRVVNGGPDQDWFQVPERPNP